MDKCSNNNNNNNNNNNKVIFSLCEQNCMYNFWGKAGQKEENKDQYHLLIYHCLDVAAVMQEWLRTKNNFILDISNSTGVSKRLLRESLLTSSGWHDTGKFSYFQSQRPDLVKKLQGIEYGKYGSHRHDKLGWILWNGKLKYVMKDKYAHSSGVNPIYFFNIFAKVSFGHHGIPVDDSKDSIISSFKESDIKAAVEFFHTITDLFLSEESWQEIRMLLSRSDDEIEHLIKKLKHWSFPMAGAISQADWLASEFCPYCDLKYTINEYWEMAQKEVENIFQKKGLCSGKPSKQSGFNYLFPEYKKPTPLQEFCDSLEIKNEPQIIILEDATGSGKTEAAQTIVSRMMQEGIIDGMHMALPTMATSNAMYTRLAPFYKKLFSSDSKPSLVLSHSARHLSEEFVKSYSDININEVPSDDVPNCSKWLASSTKKSLLADVSVGTLDQILLSTLAVRYQALRSVGLYKKVLVVDEIHAYDTYMLEVFMNVITYCVQLNIPIILLSATLPKKVLGKISQTFYQSLGKKQIKTSEIQKFPLVTKLTPDSIKHYPLPIKEELRRSIPVVFLDNDTKIIEKIIEAHKNGQSVCWIRNTVSDVIGTCKLLQDEISAEFLNIFHASFTLQDRLAIEDKILKIFGKNSAYEDRKGQVLIATQVIEQSLDVDFDVLIADLAPIDLILQRLGRLCRHLRDRKGNRVFCASQADRNPILHVHIPLESKDNIPTKDWFSGHFPKGCHVYKDYALLWRTKEILKKYSTISIPENVRDLIESVYGENPIEIPKVFLESEDKSWGQRLASITHAKINSLNIDRGYSSQCNWSNKDKVTTREGYESRTVYLAVWENEQIHPIGKHENIWCSWDLSSINIPASKVGKQYKGIGEEHWTVVYENKIKLQIEKLCEKFWIDENSLFLIRIDGLKDEWEVINCEGQVKRILKYDSSQGLQIYKEL